MKGREFLVPDANYYTKDHEWAYVDENLVTVGITDYAQDQMGDIVYVELPDPGQKVLQGGVLGILESVKAVSDLCSPVSGVVLEANESLVADAAAINDDPYKKGWMVRIEMDTEKELVSLLRASSYKKLVN